MQQSCPTKYSVCNPDNGLRKSSIVRYLIVCWCLLLASPAVSQLCQGSLGDPIVNINFGAGTNAGAPLSAATTAYQYTSSGCPNDGFYTVTNYVNSCFNGSWYNITGDHTGNANGYFMLVNASYQPSAFYVDTVRGLCGNTTYEFAAWIMNVQRPTSCNGNPTPPNLTFIIEKTDGTLLQSYNANSIPFTSAPIWKQYGFFFTTPTGVSDIVLRMVNNAPGGCGNDIGLDDITFRPCGPSIIPSIAGGTATTANICTGTARTFNFLATVSGLYSNPAYQWQQRFNGGAWSDIAGATTTNFTQIFTPTTPAGTFDFRLSVADAGNLGSLQCRVASEPLTIFINTVPIITATSNSPVCSGSILNLHTSGSAQYSWTGPNGFSAMVESPAINNIQPTQAGTYTVIATSTAGCSSTSSTTVVVQPSPIAIVGFSDTLICPKDTIQLSAGGGSRYQWFPATGLSAAMIFNPRASPAVSTRYGIVVTNTVACSDTAYVNVRIATPVIANAGPDKTIIQGSSVTLEGSILGQYLRYHWSPASAFGNTPVLQPVVTPNIATSYVLSAEAANGCGSSSDTVVVSVYKGIYIPNAFTPNGDGSNDTWSIPALNAYPAFELIVCNRYGQVVFSNRGINKPWDGTYNNRPLPNGAYVYTIRLSEDQVLKGSVLILR